MPLWKPQHIPVAQASFDIFTERETETLERLLEIKRLLRGEARLSLQVLLFLTPVHLENMTPLPN